MSSDNRLIAARYVEALFELASQENCHDAVKSDLLALKEILAESSDLQTLLVSPIISRADAAKAIASVLVASKASDLTSKFFALLAHNRRLALTPIAIEAYLERLAESRGELTAQVTSAQPLTESEAKELKSAISTSTGKKVDLKAIENPALLGGVQVRVGSRMIDNSIAGKLARLKQALSAA